MSESQGGSLGERSWCSHLHLATEVSGFPPGSQPQMTGLPHGTEGDASRPGHQGLGAAWSNGTSPGRCRPSRPWAAGCALQFFSVTTPGTVCGLGSREVVVKGTMHRSDHQHLSVWGKGQKAWQTCASGIGQYGPSYQPAPGAPHPDGMATLGAGQVGPQPRSLFNLDQPRHLRGAPGSSGENNSGNPRTHVP